jgi:hypothetical protein
MSFEEAKIKAERLRGRFDAPFSFSDKKEIEVMYWEVLGKRLSPTNCQQCYHDALIEIYLYLKNNNKMKEKSNYRLRAGFIINTPAFNNGKVYSNANLTDEVAESYLAKFPNQVKMFEALPKGFSIKSIQSKAKKAEEEAKKKAEAEAKAKKEAEEEAKIAAEKEAEAKRLEEEAKKAEAEAEAEAEAAGSDEGAGEGTEEGTDEASPEENADGAPKAENDAVGEE